MPKQTELDVEKIKSELAASSCAARQKVAAAAKAYHEDMDKLAQQLRTLKKRA